MSRCLNVLSCAVALVNYEWIHHLHHEFQPHNRRKQQEIELGFKSLNLPSFLSFLLITKYNLGLSLNVVANIVHI